MIQKNSKVKITKISDDKFNGKHPNNINEGFNTTGILYNYPTIDTCCYIGSLRTSLVTEILESDSEKSLIFKTLNSTYKIEELEEK